MCKKISHYSVYAGRILLGGYFALAGLNKVMDPTGTAGMIESVGLPMGVALAYFTGILLLALGAMLIAGCYAKYAAAGLLAFTLLVSFLYHGPGLWGDMIQQLFFMKNMAIAGGLFYIFGNEDCCPKKSTGGDPASE